MAVAGPLLLGDGDQTLELASADPEGQRSLRATLQTPHLTAIRTFHELPGVADFEQFADVIVSLADEPLGWEGERGWSSCDGDFTLVCTHNHRSGVEATVSMSDYHEGWKVTGVTILIETGHLERLAGDARAFFGSLPRAEGD